MYKKAKLNYMPAVSKTKPLRTIPVSSAEMEKLARSISEKCRQNPMNSVKTETNDFLLF